MKFLKIIISILIILLIATILAILVISTKSSTRSENNNVIAGYNELNSIVDQFDEYEPDVGDMLDESLLVTRRDFISIDIMIKNFIKYLKSENSGAVYELLEKRYATQQGIALDTVINSLKNDMNYDSIYRTKEIYKAGETAYCVCGTIEKNSNKLPYCVIIYYNNEQTAYAIKPITQEEYYTYKNQQIREEYIDNIDVGTYNKTVFESTTDENMSEKYLEDYINNARYYPEDAYNSLNEEYRSKKFGSYENYLNYITEPQKARELESLDYRAIKKREEFQTEEEYKNYIGSLKTAILEKYDIFVEDEKKYCVCVDSYDNYYIFEIESAMNYKLILDTYTMELQEFKSKYDKSTNEEKVAMNISKIFDAINDYDYNYVYNKMDEEYKASHIGTYENFVNIMKNNLFNQNKFEIEEYSDENGIYKTVLMITDDDITSTNEIKMTIIMQLKDEYNFSIKFE